MADFSSVGGQQVYGPPDVTKISNFSDAGGYAVDAYSQALRDIPKPQVIGPKEEYYATHTDETPEPDVRPGDITNIATGVGKAAVQGARDMGQVGMDVATLGTDRLMKSKAQKDAEARLTAGLQPKGTAQQVGATTFNAANTALGIADAPNLISSAYNFAREALGANPSALEALVNAADVGKAFEPVTQSPASEEMLASVGRSVGDHPAFNPQAAESLKAAGQPIPTEQTPVFPLGEEKAGPNGGPSSAFQNDMDFINSARKHGVDEDTIDAMLTERNKARDAQRFAKERVESEGPAWEENAARDKAAVEAKAAAERQVEENKKIEAEIANTPNVPTFYSKAENVATAKLPGSGNGDSMLATLKNNGVKQDEMDWMGLEDFLKGKQKVSKKDVLEFIRNNGINLKEETLGEKSPEVYNRLLANKSRLMVQVNTLADRMGQTDPQALFRLYDYAGAKGDVLQTLDEVLQGTSPEFQKDARQFVDLQRQVDGLSADISTFNNETASPTKYDQYILPHSGYDQREPLNYREKLFKLETPIRDEKAVNAAKEKVAQLQTELANMHDKINSERDPVTGELRDATPDESAKMQMLRNEIYDQQQIAKQADPLFTAPHFRGAGAQGDAAQNLLAHTRYTDRTLENGDRALMVEEVQSDWHQKGREKGYTSDLKDLDAQVKAAQSRVDKAKEAYSKIATLDVSPFSSRHPNSLPNSPEYKELWDASERLEEAKRAYNRAQNTKVPNAPLKTTWHEMVLKRMLREAAEKGYDRLAWTTGEQQAKRYDSLLENVGRIEYNPTEWEVVVYDTDGNHLATETARNKEELVGIVGQNMGEELWDKAEDYNPGPDRDSLAESFYEDAAQDYSVEPVLDEDGNPTDEYKVVDRNGETVEDGYETQRDAERARERHINDEVQYQLDNYEPDSEELPSIEGDGITIGAEGHSGFYDKIVPEFLKKYVKKWGGTIEDLPLKDTDEGGEQVVHTIKITPKMRKSVLKEGQPIAQNQQPQGQPQPPANPYQFAQQSLG